MYKPMEKVSTLVVFAALAAKVDAHGIQFLDQAPNVTNALEYHQDIDLASYYVSEKLDGIRAIWTGKELVTRSGRILNAPKWFVKDLPEITIEGELWAGRGGFGQVQKTVLDKVPDSSQWQAITFMLFDVPGHLGSFEQRYGYLKNYCESLPYTHIQCVEQKVVETHKDLQALLTQVTHDEAEGLMLKKRHEIYHPGRNDSLIKVKTVQDTEGIVVGYKPGKGKYDGMMGAILVEINGGVRLYIGTGFTDEERANPPAIGKTIMFKHNGWTENGIPRFARYHRIRETE
ncbi:DNA ligase [Vibrio sp. 10N]|uniref:DNA ligase n=1 Tax=Vibrio sp. 10N TaxID=3058938 RepID=UPI0028137C4A|nr:DNA ligase [Vibrio sp. 10N]